MSGAMARGLFRLDQRVVAAPDLAAARQHDALVDIVCVACAHIQEPIRLLHVQRGMPVHGPAQHARSLDLPADVPARRGRAGTRRRPAAMLSYSSSAWLVPIPGADPLASRPARHARSLDLPADGKFRISREPSRALSINKNPAAGGAGAGLSTGGSPRLGTSWTPNRASMPR
jgi:hypothetical protein